MLLALVTVSDFLSRPNLLCAAGCVVHHKWTQAKPDHAGNVSGVADTASSRRNVTEFDNTVFAIFTVVVQTVDNDRSLKGNYELWGCSKQTAARMK